MINSDSLRHPWIVSTAEARVIQETLREQVIKEDQLGTVRYVAGVDAGFEKQDGQTITRAAVAVLTFPELELHEHAIVRRPTTFPYVPGYLSFREAEALIEAVEQLNTRPDLLLCDGQGLVHPRRFGLACHIGLLTNIPSIGVAKTHFIGKHAEVDQTRGAWQTLYDKKEPIGAVLRTRTGVKPLYVSIGHRISLPTAIDYVMACTPRYRLPETTRWSHRLASGLA